MRNGYKLSKDKGSYILVFKRLIKTCSSLCLLLYGLKFIRFHCFMGGVFVFFFF